MTWPRWVLLFTGLACIGMGVQSYFFPLEGSKASMVSLIAAGGVGLLLVVCMVVSLKNPRLGYIPALVLCLLLIGRFVSSGVKDGFTLYPGIISIALGVICAGSLLAGHMLAKAAKQTSSA